MDIEDIKRQFKELIFMQYGYNYYCDASDVSDLYEAFLILAEDQQSQLTNLKTENESLKKSKWISVDDRLPEIRSDELNFEVSTVLVVSEKGSIQIKLASQLIDTMIEGSYYYKIFTHWQPLPNGEGLINN